MSAEIQIQYSFSQCFLICFNSPLRCLENWGNDIEFLAITQNEQGSKHSSLGHYRDGTALLYLLP